MMKCNVRKRVTCVDYKSNNSVLCSKRHTDVVFECDMVNVCVMGVKC